MALGVVPPSPATHSHLPIPPCPSYEFCSLCTAAGRHDACGRLGHLRGHIYRSRITRSGQTPQLCTDSTTAADATSGDGTSLELCS
jgi:hypothetical protein